MPTISRETQEDIPMEPLDMPIIPEEDDGVVTPEVEITNQ